MKKEHILDTIKDFLADNWVRLGKCEVDISIKDTNEDVRVRKNLNVDVVCDE